MVMLLNLFPCGYVARFLGTRINSPRKNILVELQKHYWKREGGIVNCTAEERDACAATNEKINDAALFTRLALALPFVCVF
jgi:hypothetical protein